LQKKKRLLLKRKRKNPPMHKIYLVNYLEINYGN
jgi:hypothetical protein